jgi:hypothetical protein
MPLAKRAWPMKKVLIEMHIIHHVPLNTLAMVNALVKMHITHPVLVETLVRVNPPLPIETHLAMTMGKCPCQNALSLSYSHYNFSYGKHSFWNAHGL